MDIPADVLAELTCSSCEAYLSRGPVYLQHDGAAVCGLCYTPKRPATRNTQYEATAKLLRYPCKNRELGCPETVPFAGEAEELAHEVACEHRQYVCPVLGSARCDWLGPRAAMLAHCRDQHPDSVLESPCSLTHDISKPSLANYIINAFQMLFLLHTKVCVASGKIYHAVRFLGAADDAANYHFTLDIKREDEQLTKKGQVAGEGCLAIQEDTSLSLDTNCLLGVLGGFDGATFTVTVKRRVSAAAEQLARAEERCGTCKAEVTVFVYRDVKGWRCERCVPARRACVNQDCQHTDISKKCYKHEFYFCQQGSYCNICNVQVSRGSLSAHYGSVHQGITHRAGSTWWATETSNNYQKCLMSTAVGTAVCIWFLNSSQFDLFVYTAVSSERLREYRCTVQVTDPGTGHTRTFTPQAMYDNIYDWHILIKKDECCSWNVVFDVSVDITRT